MIRSRYPGLSGEQLIKYLKKHYHITVISQKGSHIKVQYKNYKTIIPNHKHIAYGTFSAILEQLRIDEELFLSDIGH